MRRMRGLKSGLHSVHATIVRDAKGIVMTALAVFVICSVLTDTLAQRMHAAYQTEISVITLDGKGRTLEIRPNTKDAFMVEATGTKRFRELLVRAEDRYFIGHAGVNPVSIARALIHRLILGERIGGSTLTQQLTKNLLGNTNERTLKNKLIETAYALSLELHTPKADILTMYENSAYFGNRREGVEEAARYYFGKTASDLTDGEIVRLLSLLSAPSFPPGTAGNTERAMRLAKRIGVSEIGEYRKPPKEIVGRERDSAMFELGDLLYCENTCKTTVDRELTGTIREIVRDRLGTPSYASVSNAAVAVIALGDGDEPNRLLALVGTPNPLGSASGLQINMALAERPIGSTWKPFIYGKAVERGARPYTQIDDAEYRYEIGTGFAFYPKNYDGIYRGPVTLNYALSNSLNVPAVRALQFDGIDEFGDFMQHDLGFIPRQSFDTYQLSIALGGLEMNPLLLANYFSVFPRKGLLTPLSLGEGRTAEIPMLADASGNKRIFAATTTEIITRMLTDRLMGVEQFGLEGNLNLPYQEYAVKTGTTYDYHDSWCVGFTPDVVVAVWVGNSDNKAMDLVTGSKGAGKIWHDVMSLLYANGHITPKKFDASSLVSVSLAEGESFGLLGDDIERARTIMSGNEILLEPHDGDVLQYEAGMSVPLRARVPLQYFIDGKLLGRGDDLFWSPQAVGDYLIEAKRPDGSSVETLHIHVVPKR